MLASNPSRVTRSEKNVPKNPLASWTVLVPTMSVPMAARIDHVGCMISPLRDDAEETGPGHVLPSAEYSRPLI